MEEIDSQIATWLTMTYPVDMPYILSSEQREDLIRRHNIYQRFVSEFPVSLGKDVSRIEREGSKYKNVRDSTLVYGETDFIIISEFIYGAITKFNLLPGARVFYDLGSGTGKCVATAAFLSKFDVCRGIELVEGLFNISLSIKSKYDEEFPRIQSENPDLFSFVPSLEFILNDIFEVDWSDADLIFVNSTCFEPEMMVRLGKKKLKFGTVAITNSRPISGENWIMLETYRKKMNWGDTIIYTQRYVNTEDIARVSKKLNDLVVDSDLID
jgi:Histone methylation protein DOT1